MREIVLGYEILTDQCLENNNIFTPEHLPLNSRDSRCLKAKLTKRTIFLRTQYLSTHALSS